MAPCVQPGKDILNNILSGGLIAHDQNREAEQLSVVTPEQLGQLSCGRLPALTSPAGLSSIGRLRSGPALRAGLIEFGSYSVHDWRRLRLPIGAGLSPIHRSPAETLVSEEVR